MENEEIQNVELEESPKDNFLADVLRAAGMDDSDYEEESSIEDNPKVEETGEPSEEKEVGSEEDIKGTDEPKPYTLEELVELGKSESLDKINTARIPPELKAAYKSLEAMATRRQQSLAEKEKHLDELIGKHTGNAQGVNAPSGDEEILSRIPTNVSEVILQNPEKAYGMIQAQLREIDQQIAAAHAADNIFEVTDLLLKKDDLREQAQSIVWLVESAKEEYGKVLEAIPDYPQKLNDLKAFVQTLDDPFTDEEIHFLTNPMIFGPLARKLVKLVNRTFETEKKMSAARKSVEEKLKKEPPAKLNRPGSGGEPQVKKTTGTEHLKRYKQTQDISDAAEWIASMTRKA